MSTSIQEQTERLAKAAATSVEAVLDDPTVVDLSRELLIEALGKIADIIVLNGK